MGDALPVTGRSVFNSLAQCAPNAGGNIANLAEQAGTVAVGRFKRLGETLRMCALNGVGIWLPDVLRCLLTIFNFCAQLFVQGFFVYGQFTILLSHIVSTLQVIQLIHLLKKGFLLLNLTINAQVLYIGNNVSLFGFQSKLVIDDLLSCFQFSNLGIQLRVILCLVHLKNAVQQLSLTINRPVNKQVCLLQELGVLQSKVGELLLCHGSTGVQPVHCRNNAVKAILRTIQAGYHVGEIEGVHHIGVGIFQPFDFLLQFLEGHGAFFGDNVISNFQLLCRHFA